MPLKLVAKLVCLTFFAAGGLVAILTTGLPKSIALGCGVAGLAGLLVLAVFGGGGDPDKQAGSGPPPLRWGG